MNEKNLFNNNFQKNFQPFLNALQQVSIPDHDCHRGPEDACPVCDSEDWEWLRCAKCGMWIYKGDILPNGLCESCYNEEV
jgi:hypothetical protein